MNIAEIIAPLVLVGLVGFIATKSRWLSREQLDALSKFTFHLAIPAYLFLQMAQADIKSQLDMRIYGAFYLPVIFVFFIAYFTNYFFHNQYQNKYDASAVYGLASSYSNNIIVGLPVILLALGEALLPIVFMIVVFHSAMLFTLTSVLAEKGQQRRLVNTIKATFINPLIISIVAGACTNLLLTLTGLELPRVLTDSLALLGKPAISLALFSLGGSMTYYQVKNEKYFISFACLLKLIALPGLVLLACNGFDLSAQVSQVLVIMSACPTGVNAYLIAKNYQHHQDTVAGSVVASTVLSVVTIPFWLFIVSQ
ncbi:AEC family transporter [Thalassotalea sp. LPB0316]|uniref:AEC family transporter n=1 Tax=Thalassotalea sp. LPB0316 TaxID=2769490 RepID=UPI0018695F4C|nr:AEC family transporter [Thalassotalea sp. LPB0316]QOL25689.1 AEC family transporter [Thalassotalea sp. LPB0316]